MPSFKVGASGEGAVGGLLDFVLERKAERKDRETELRKHQQRIVELGLDEAFKNKTIVPEFDAQGHFTNRFIKNTIAPSLTPADLLGATGGGAYGPPKVSFDMATGRSTASFDPMTPSEQSKQMELNLTKQSTPFPSDIGGSVINRQTGYSGDFNPEETRAGYPQRFAQRRLTALKSTTGLPAIELTPLSPQATPEERQSWLSQLTPTDQEIVKGLSDYTLDPSKTSSLFRGNERQRMLALAKMYNPTFDMKSFTAAQQYVNPNTKVGQNIASLNTLVSHTKYLKDSISELQASGLPAKNALVMFSRQLIGDPGITDFDTAKEVVDNELQRALTGVGVTQEGIKRASGILKSRNFGSRQAQQYVESLLHIMQARLETLERGYRQQVNREPGDLIIYPESRQILESVIHPEVSSSPVEVTEGQTATNPKTGQKIVFRGGGWVPR